MKAARQLRFFFCLLVALAAVGLSWQGTDHLTVKQSNCFASNLKRPKASSHRQTLQVISQSGATQAPDWFLSVKSEEYLLADYDARWMSWLKKDIHTVKVVLERVADPSLRERLILHVVKLLLRADPSVSLHSLIKGLAEKSMAHEAIGYFFKARAELAPEQALDWVTRELPTGAAKEQALLAILQRWSEKDPVATASWLLQQQVQTADFDQAVYALSSNIVKQDPASAFQWICTVKDKELRIEGLAQLAQHWHNHDPNALMKFVEQHDFPRDELSAVMHPFARSTTTEKTVAAKNLATGFVVYEE
jgi:hypothetical protein